MQETGRRRDGSRYGDVIRIACWKLSIPRLLLAGPIVSAAADQILFMDGGLAGPRSKTPGREAAQAPSTIFHIPTARRTLMRLFVLVAVQALLVPAGTVASAADPCALLSKGDATALLGQPVVAVVPAGPERDEDSGGQLTYCTYRGASAAVVVSVVEFTSDAEARKQLSINIVRDRMDAEDAKVTEEPGIGDRAFFGASSHGAMYVFLKKNKVVGIALGGAAAPVSAASKPQLKASALAIAAKL